MRRLISRKEIRYYFLWPLVVTKIQRPKIFKMEKKKRSINNKTKKKKKPPASRDERITPVCAFSMNQSVGAGSTQ